MGGRARVATGRWVWCGLACSGRSSCCPIPGCQIAGPPHHRGRLAVAAGRIVSVDQLETEPWPDVPPRSARNLLRQYIPQIRRDLGGASEPGLWRATRTESIPITERPRAVAVPIFVDVERGAQPGLAGCGDLHTAAGGVGSQPVSCDQRGGHRHAERATEVGAAFGPVQAGPGEPPSGAATGCQGRLPAGRTRPRRPRSP